MINLTVVHLKDVFKSLVKFIAIIILIIICTRLFNILKNINLKEYVANKFDGLKGKTFIECINENISLYSSEKEKDESEKNADINEKVSSITNGVKSDSESKNLISTIKDNFLNSIFSLDSGLLSYTSDVELSNSENLDGEVAKENESSDNESTDSNNLVIASKTGAVTEVIEENNKVDSYNKTYGTVKIRNESKYSLSKSDLTPDIDFENKTDIVIYHTHTCESYTMTEKYTYKSSGNFRTTDLDYSVARVGTELTNYLEKYGFNVIHDTTYHDYPKYNGSYQRSLETVQNIMETSNASLVIDLHRDALGSNSEYAPTVKINGEEAAQIMFVIGTDGGGLTHDNWKDNLKLAIKIQEIANEMYPGLFKPIIVRNSRYNQHVAQGACIIEVGATGNTLEQCLVSMKYLSSVIDEVMNGE